MSKKLSLVVMCGGNSVEHEVSIRSAKNVVSALDKSKYSVAVVYINHQSEWHYVIDTEQFLNLHPANLVSTQQAECVTVQLGARDPTLISLTGPVKHYPVDCVFSLVHGAQGEDGCLQGLFELLGVAFVGSGVLGSALCMDKAVAKQVMNNCGIATTPGSVLTSCDARAGVFAQLAQQLGKTLYLKPASLGSSVGVSKVCDESSFLSALRKALNYDPVVVVEKAIEGREIECAVLGNDAPVAALPAEIISHTDFYTYEAKYLNPRAATTMVPAMLDSDKIREVQETAIAAFLALRAQGLLRVDFFLQADGCLLVNEANTIPGFTSISLYPAMWHASGVPYTELMDRLIALALDNHQQKKRLNRSYSPDIRVSVDETDQAPLSQDLVRERDE